MSDHEFCFVVEQNRDAQLRSLLLLETPVAKDKLRSILVYGGFPLSASQRVDQANRNVTRRGRKLPSIAKPVAAHPSLQRNRTRTHHPRL